ncbi:MAG: hypothetical protein WBQ16_05365 [Nitrososphaeraceae archaeon]
MVAVIGIIGLVYALSVQLPNLEELKKEQAIAREDVISATSVNARECEETLAQER